MQVKGEIVSIKNYENDFGSVTKILVVLTAPVAHARTKVFVTAGAWLGTEPVKGAEVEFVATFETSAADPLFAKGSRPTAPKAPKPAKAPKAKATA